MPNKRALISVLILWMFLLPVGKGIAQLNTGAWPMRGHDARHTGQSEYTEMAFGALKWRYLTGSPVTSSPAIGSDGTVYVGSEDDYLYALNPDGTLKWRYLTGSDVTSSPAIGTDGTVYAGSEDNYLYALNSDGTLKWRYLTGSPVTSSPAIGIDGTVYVGSEDNYLYALNPNGTLQWRYLTGSAVTSSPAIGTDGTVYVGCGISWSSDYYLYALNFDGTLKWRYLTDSYVTSSPAVGSDGTVYVGTAACLYALNPDGSLKWRYQGGTYVINYTSSPAIGCDGTVYVGFQDRYLYAINPDGTLKWRYLLGGFITHSSSAIGSDGTVYVGSRDGYLYALNPDGTLKWRYQTGYIVFSSPAIGSDGTVYVGSRDSFLYAFHTQSQGAVRGIVRSMATDLGALVTLSAATGSNTLSSAGGYYSLMLGPGTYNLAVSGAGYQTLTIPSVVVRAGDVTPLDILVPTTGPLNLTREAFVPGSVGQPFKDRAWVAGGTYPYVFSISYGTVPPGCILDTATGFITGTPTTPGSYTFAIGVRDQHNAYSEREYTIDVTAPLDFTAMTLPRATKNTPYFYDLSITGGLSPYTIIRESGGLPTGLTMSATGRLTGTPTIIGRATFTAKVTDAAGRILRQNFSLPVDYPLSISTPNLNTGITGQPYNQTLQGTGGYGGYTWSVYSGTLPQGINLDASTGVLSGTPQTAATMPLVIMAEDSVGRQAFKNLPLIVTAPLAFVTTTLPNGARNETYSEQVRVSGGLAPYQFTYTGTLPTGLSLNQTNGVISGTPTAAMLNNIQITVTDSSLPTPQTVTATLALRVTSLLTINSSAVLPTARLNQAISPVVLRAVSGISPYQWSLTGGSLPPGISLDAATGQLTGTPTAAGDYIFTIMVTDSKQPAQTATKEFIYHVARTLTIDTNALPRGGKDVFYSFTLPVSGGRSPYAWRVKTGTLPAGLTLDSVTGTIAGIPAAAASVQVTIAVTDGDTPAQTAEKTFAINITDKLFITTTSLPNGRLGQAYTANINVALGTPPYSFAVTAGLLPTGLSMASNAMNATISGTPTVAGTATFTVTVTDNSVPVQTSTNQYTVNVYSLIAITTTKLANALKGGNYDQTIAVAGGLPPYTWTVSTGQLPAGLSLDSATGRITGSPSWPPGMSAEFTVRVADAGTPALPVQKLFVIFVLDPMTNTEIQGTFQQAGNSLGLTWSSATGLTYQIQSVTNLPAASWQNEGAAFSGTGGVVSTNIPLGPQPKKYFRLRLLGN